MNIQSIDGILYTGSFSNFNEKYPVDVSFNSLIRDAGDDAGNFESFGADLDFIKEFNIKNGNKIWSLINSPIGFVQVAGFLPSTECQYVRQYMISLNPWTHLRERYILIPNIKYLSEVSKCYPEYLR